MTFKENWEKTDTLCPTCGTVQQRAKGMTRQNMKRLFSLNLKDTNGLLITAMIILMCFTAWAYSHDTKVCREFMLQKYNQEAMAATAIDYAVDDYNKLGGLNELNGLNGNRSQELNLTFIFNPPYGQNNSNP